MPKFLAGLRVAAGLSAGALLFAAGPSLAVAKHGPKHHKKHAKHHKSKPAGDFALPGISTTVTPQGVGDIHLPSAVSAAQILQRFGAPGPAKSSAETITRVKGAIIAIHYPFRSPAGITFNWSPYGSPGSPLNSIVIGSRAYRTAQGLHVGSTASEVQSALPQALCQPDVCSTRTVNPDGTVSNMSFDMVGGTVTQIDLSTEQSA